jgi:mRNA interferase MazF
MSELPRDPKRGEIWRVSFNPTKGQEIQKVRPALVIGLDQLGHWGLRIVAPITDGRDRYKEYPWFVGLNATASNGLEKDSEADASQVKSLSVDRFQDKLGIATDAQVQQVAAAIALCVGYEPEIA